jgi:Rrf2 family transcriptional regulator, iron-sulfur cluster assembly transcription factor
MFTLSQTTSYAIRALTHLARTADDPQFISGIARATGVPKDYLAKILPRLREARIVDSKRGYTGGVWLSRPPDKISLLAVSNAIEGPGKLSRCLLGFNVCSSHSACPIHDRWTEVRRTLEQELGSVTLADLVDGELAGKRGKRADKKVRVSI